eukprot:XP_014042049.1 PREDICTED: uncharacterized protein LOC106595193 isoform X1 [Salmo salar]
MTVTGKGGEEEDVFRVKEEEDMTVTVKEEEEKKGIVKATKTEGHKQNVNIEKQHRYKERKKAQIGEKALGERPDYHSDTRKSPTGVSDPVTSKPARLFPVVKRDLSGNHG